MLVPCVFSAYVFVLHLLYQCAVDVHTLVYHCDAKGVTHLLDATSELKGHGARRETEMREIEARNRDKAQHRTDTKRKHTRVHALHHAMRAHVLACMLHVACGMWRVACVMLHVAC